MSVLLTWPLPTEASVHGHALDQHLLLNLEIILVLAVLLHALLFWALFRSPDPRAAESGRRRTLRLEAIPLLAFTVLFGVLAARSERLWARSRYTGASLEALQVEVTGMQFAWYFRYPGPDATFGRTDLAQVDAGAGNPLGLEASDPHGSDDIVSSELVLPAEREVDLRLRAQDVIHGFAVPEMRLKQNAIPGSTVHLHFTPERPGTYAILCTQLCGLGHYRMGANLRVLPQGEFEQWLRSRSQGLPR